MKHSRQPLHHPARHDPRGDRPTPGFRELTSRSELPANEHAETTILGAVLLDNAAMPEMRARRLLS